MRVADYIFKFFTDRDIDEVFMVAGGHAMFLNNAVAQNKQLRFTCTHHEQAATMAADAYGRLRGKPAIALVTAGPGSMNALTGVAGGWVDSSPMIIISGQSNYSVVDFQKKNKLRQYGVQGIGLHHIVEEITKYFVMVDDPKKVVQYLHRAYEAATTGRPGPVWLDVPLDIQRAELTAEFILNAEHELANETFCASNNTELSNQVQKVYELLAHAERPLFLVGQGVRLANALGEFEELTSKVAIPILTSRLGIDVIASDNPLYAGRPGTYGDRAANFAVQNSDLIIAVGCRLSIALTGYNVKDFGRNARKVVVDSDSKELQKPDLNIVLPIHDSVKKFLTHFLRHLTPEKKTCFPEWLKICKDWRARYPVVLPSYKDEKPVNSYYFMEKLSSLASPDDYVVVDMGSCSHVASQVWQIKPGQRFLATGGLGSMGYWAAGIGASVAKNRGRTIVITGDGGFQMNLQELATVKGYNLPLKIFILNNNGYLLIRHTQRNFFDNQLIGEGPTSGLWFPDSLKLAAAYGIKAARISTVQELDTIIHEVLACEGPVICDVLTPEWQAIAPRVASEKDQGGNFISKPYEDMFPFLSAKELALNMIVKTK